MVPETTQTTVVMVPIGGVTESQSSPPKVVLEEVEDIEIPEIESSEPHEPWVRLEVVGSNAMVTVDVVLLAESVRDSSMGVVGLVGESFARMVPR